MLPSLHPERFVILVAAMLLTAGCAGPIAGLYPVPKGERPRTVYVVNHGGLHTGLVVKVSDLPKAGWCASKDYPKAEYLEVGWGDDDGYRKDFTTGIVLKALIHSERTVLCYDGFRGSVPANYDDPEVRIVSVDLSRRGFERLCDQLARNHELGDDGKTIALGDDWYRGRGTYYILHTCNSWVADGLRAAGCPINIWYCQLPGPLLHEVRKFGKVLPAFAEPAR